jgi:hypothetical protein
MSEWSLDILSLRAFVPSPDVDVETKVVDPLPRLIFHVNPNK